MVCCLLTAVLTGKLGLARALAARPSAVAKLWAVGLVSGAALLAPVAAAHAGHYVERAGANGRSVLEELLAAPLCDRGFNTEKAT